MTLQQQIWRSSDADLARDLAKYQQAIADQQMPEMIPHWTQAVGMIEGEMAHRQVPSSAQIEVPF